MYELLKEYKTKHGHTQVPLAFVNEESGESLGAWANHQRRCYSRMKAGSSSESLTQVRIDKLNELGFEWTVPVFAQQTESP